MKCIFLLFIITIFSFFLDNWDFRLASNWRLEILLENGPCYCSVTKKLDILELNSPRWNFANVESLFFARFLRPLGYIFHLTIIITDVLGGCFETVRILWTLNCSLTINQKLKFKNKMFNFCSIDHRVCKMHLHRYQL